MSGIRGEPWTPHQRSPPLGVWTKQWTFVRRRDVEGSGASIGRRRMPDTDYENR